MTLFSMVKNMIKLGAVSNSDNTSTEQFPQSQYTFMGKPKDVVNVYPYGMIANAPIGELALLMNVGGNSENTIAIPMSTDSRPKGLKAGEAEFGNFKIGTTIKFDEQGNIIITSTKEVTITSPTVNIISTTTHDGDVTINGNLQVNGDIDSTGTITGATVTGGTVDTTGGIDLDTHVHLDVAVPPVPGQTGPPV